MKKRFYNSKSDASDISDRVFSKKQRQDCRNFAFADGHVESINGYKLIDGGVSGNGYKFSAFWMKGNRFGQHTN